MSPLNYFKIAFKMSLLVATIEMKRGNAANYAVMNTRQLRF